MNQKYHQKQDIRDAERSLRGCTILFFVVFVISAIMGMIGFSNPASSQGSFISLIAPWFIIFIVCGISLAIWASIISSKKKDWLKIHGRTIQATVTNSRTQTSIDNKNHRHSTTYYLDLEWHNPQTGEVSKFSTSSSSRSILRPRGSFIPVHIDPNDPKFYQVDV